MPRRSLVLSRGLEADTPFHFGRLSDRDLNERQSQSKRASGSYIVCSDLIYWAVFQVPRYTIYNIRYANFHPPSPETTGMPVEEGERSSAATVDSACANCRVDEPYEAPKRFFFAKYLTCFASKESILRSNMRKQHCEEDRKFWSEVGSLKQDWDHGLGRGVPFL